MIKVIRKNKKVKCNKCGAVLKFEAEDVKVKYYDDTKEIRSAYIECPICKAKKYFE